VRQIIRQTPPKSERQTLLFSATFTDDVMNLAKQWTTDPAIVEIEPENVASETVEQHVYAVAGSDKYKLLYNLVTRTWERVMVFANRKDEVRRIEERLVRDGINAAQLSGDVPQHKRIRPWKASAKGASRAGGHRRGRPRHPHRRHQPRDQLHPAGRPGRLRAPHRPYWPRGGRGRVDQLRR
jgi:superfamily II DNA/RNA helicase